MPPNLPIINSIAVLNEKVYRLERCVEKIEKSIDCLERSVEDLNLYKARISGVGIVLTFAASFGGMLFGAWIKHFF